MILCHIMQTKQVQNYRFYSIFAQIKKYGIMRTDSVLSILKFIILPKKAWTDADKEYSDTALADAKGDNRALNMLSLFSGIASLAAFIANLHFTENRGDSGMETALKIAVITFVQFFAAYFATAYATGKLIGKEAGKARCDMFAAVLCTATVLLYIAGMFVPSGVLPYIAMLSLYIVYIAWSGARHFLKVTENAQGRFIPLISFVALLLPAIIAILLKLLMRLV